jgi:hypothetical protein
MTRRYHDDLEVGGRDAIDIEIAPTAPLVASGRLAQLLRTRAALGLRPLAAPALVFVPIGLLLGRYGLGVLSDDLLVHLDFVLAIALAALGLFVGLALDLRGRFDVRLLVAANVESAMTIAIVAGCAWWLLVRWDVPLGLASSVVALALGVAASASSAGHVDSAENPLTRTATRIADLDDGVPLLVGGFALALMRHPPAAAAGYTLLTCALGLLVGLAGWLLFERAHGPAERGVFVIGAVALLGGAPAFLGLSPLLAGLVAGLFWTYAPGHADQIIRDDLRRLQHPLVVILLIAAGATLRFSMMALWLFVPFVAFRLAGKLAGGWIASRLTRGLAPADLGAWLVPPGLIGLAFAFSVDQVLGPDVGRALLSAVVLGTLASEIIAVIVVPDPEAT